MQNGKYRTAKGSTVEISGKHSGITRVDFDWVEEEGACVDCEPEPYPEDYGDGDWRLVWTCEFCGEGNAKLIREESIKGNCPECLRTREREELETFGGFCERCWEPLDEE